MDGVSIFVQEAVKTGVNGVRAYFEGKSKREIEAEKLRLRDRELTIEEREMAIKEKSAEVADALTMAEVEQAKEQTGMMAEDRRKKANENESDRLANERTQIENDELRRESQRKDEMHAVQIGHIKSETAKNNGNALIRVADFMIKLKNELGIEPIGFTDFAQIKELMIAANPLQVQDALNEDPRPAAS